MGETDCGGNCFFFWWAGPFSVNLLSNFLLMGWIRILPWCLAWGQAVVGVMAPPSKGIEVHCCIQCPWPHSRPLSTHTSTRDSWTLTGKSGSVSCEDIASFFWLRFHKGFVCALQGSISPILWKFCNQIPLASRVKFPRGSQSLCQIPRMGNLGVLELS